MLTFGYSTFIPSGGSAPDENTEYVGRPAFRIRTVSETQAFFMIVSPESAPVNVRYASRSPDATAFTYAPYERNCGTEVVGVFSDAITSRRRSNSSA